MAVKMRTGRLTTKTTDPKTGARISDPDVYGKEVDGGTVSSWPEVRTMYQQGKLKKTFEGRTVPKEVKSYLEGKTNTLNDKEFDEPILMKQQDVSGEYTGLAANLREGGSRYSAMEKSFKGAGINVAKSVGKKINYDMAEVPHSESNKMQGVGITTDLEYIRKKSQEDNKPVKPSDDLIKLPVKTSKQAVKSASVKGPKTLPQRESAKKSTSGWFGDYVPSMRGVSKKDQKQFVSYASETGLGESFVDKSKKSIDEYKSEMKYQRRQYAKEGNVEGIKATTADIRQARNASKFTNSNSWLKSDPEIAAGYKANQAAEKEYQSSNNNAANRNTIKSQLKTLKGIGYR